MFTHKYSLKIVFLYILVELSLGFPGGSVVTNLPSNAADAGDVGSVPGQARSPEVANTTHFSILAWKNPMDREASWTKVHVVAKSQT